LSEERHWVHGVCATFIPRVYLQAASQGSALVARCVTRAMVIRVPWRQCCVCGKRAGGMVKCAADGCAALLHPYCAFTAGLRLASVPHFGAERHFLLCKEHSVSAAACEPKPVSRSAASSTHQAVEYARSEETLGSKLRRLCRPRKDLYGSQAWQQGHGIRKHASSPARRTGAEFDNRPPMLKRCLPQCAGEQSSKRRLIVPLQAQNKSDRTDMSIPHGVLVGSLVWAEGLHGGSHKLFKGVVVAIRTRWPPLHVKWVEDASGCSHPLALPELSSAYLPGSVVVLAQSREVRGMRCAARRRRREQTAVTRHNSA